MDFVPRGDWKKVPPWCVVVEGVVKVWLPCRTCVLVPSFLYSLAKGESRWSYSLSLLVDVWNRPNT
jgi:hypothetical protein